MNEYQRMAAQYGAEYVDLTKVQWTPALLQLVPAELARQCQILPVAENERQIALAMADVDLQKLGALGSQLDREIGICIADKSQLEQFIAQCYGSAAR